jgi:hypothetical protein
MEEIQTESINNLVGQHIYSIKHKLSADEEYGYSGNITTTYSAIAIPSDYEVVA